MIVKRLALFHSVSIIIAPCLDDHHLARFPSSLSLLVTLRLLTNRVTKERDEVNET